jgi:glycosyltransferase involved in cell wall biosynthesis
MKIRRYRERAGFIRCRSGVRLRFSPEVSPRPGAHSSAAVTSWAVNRSGAVLVSAPNPSPADRKTIGVVVPSFEDTGGVAAVTEFILRAIARRPDFDVRIISLATSARDACSLLASSPRTWRRGVTSSPGRQHGHDFVHVGARFGEFEFQRLAPRPQLARLLEGCDLIQVVAGVPAWARPVIGLGRPVVLQAATLTAVERRMRRARETGPLALWRAAMTRIVARLDAAALRQVDAVMVANPWMQAHALAAARGRPVRVLYAPPGVDTAVFRPAAADEAPAERPYILAVGRFSDIRKNPLLLLTAYARLLQGPDDGPDLVLAGSDPPAPEFWARARALGLGGRIRMVLGPGAEALAALFRRSLCLVLSSDEEGFGVVVIEAMASGVPVVSTRCGGPDGIITDGVDGYLVDRDDAEAMAERLGRLALDPGAARAMGRRALATVEARFADRIAGEAFLKVYDDLLAARPRVEDNPLPRLFAGERAG